METNQTNTSHIITGVEMLTPSLTEEDRNLIDEKAVLLRHDIRRDLFGGHEPPAPWAHRLDTLRTTIYEEVSTLVPVILERHGLK